MCWGLWFQTTHFHWGKLTHFRPTTTHLRPNGDLHAVLLVFSEALMTTPQTHHSLVDRTETDEKYWDQKHLWPQDSRLMYMEDHDIMEVSFLSWTCGFPFGLTLFQLMLCCEAVMGSFASHFGNPPRSQSKSGTLGAGRLRNFWNSSWLIPVTIEQHTLQQSNVATGYHGLYLYNGQTSKLTIYDVMIWE